MGNKLSLRIRHSIIEAHQGKLIIGILGTHKGAGVTHLGIQLAHYMSECLGRKTSLLECYPQNDLQYLQVYFNEGLKEKEADKFFSIHGVTYYKNVKEQEIGEIIGSQFDCVILDLGSDFARWKNEFLRCDKRLVVSNTSIWKQPELIKFIDNTNHIKLSEQWLYVSPFGQSNELRKISKEVNRRILSVPYEPKLFALSEETILLFQKML